MKRNRSFWIVTIDYLSGETNSDHIFSHRFINDKAFLDSDKELIIGDGIVLNSRELFVKYGVDTLTDVYKLILGGVIEPKELIGCFTVFLYDKENQRGFTFGNQTGDASVFYSIEKSMHTVILSNDFNKLCVLTPKRKLNEESAYQLCSHGFFLSDNTIVAGIHRLQAGKRLIFAKGEKPKVDIYHHFDFLTKRQLTMDEAVEGVDKHFRKAVKRCFDKDLEYGYKKHLASISGGLDSRMVNWVAHNMGYANIINDTYSQTGSDEMRYAFETEAGLGNQLYYRPLDDHTFIYDIESICRSRYGMAYYVADACKTQIDDILDFDTLGLLHTGQIGDALIGSDVKRNTEGDWNVDIGRVSYLLQSHSIEEQYSCFEDYFFYTHVFQFTLCTSYSASDYTYIVSPFLDRELMEYCFSIPNEMRWGHKLYWRWVDAKYPDAGAIPSTRKRFYKLETAKDYLDAHWAGLRTRIGGIINPLLFKLSIRNSATSRNHMNPYDFWYETNPTTHSFINNYYKENLHLLDAYPEINDSVEKLMRSNAFDKLLAISLLATVKVYIND